jgi:hypothetical protein
MISYWKLMGLEKPAGVWGTAHLVEDMSWQLPSPAQERGMVMLDIAYREPAMVSLSRDPVIIFNREGNIVHVWPDDYIPGYLEIERVCRDLDKAV